MSDLRVQLYAGTDQVKWDAFVAGADVDCFLFRRDFMEYHADRFQDHSLLFYSGEDLIAVLPAHLHDQAELHSHGGLTFGGLIFKSDVELKTRKATYQALLSYSRENAFRKILLKTSPDYFKKQPDQADQHFLLANKFRPVRQDLSFVVDLFEPLQLSQRRKRGLKTAAKAGVRAEFSSDLKTFWQTVLEPNLKERFASKPVHTLDEIARLAARFPENIKLLAAFDPANVMTAGLLLFINERSAHTQYISASPAGKEHSALDLLVITAMETHFKNKRYFSLGTSMTEQGRDLNWGLAEWKLEFGAKTFAHGYYEWSK